MPHRRSLLRSLPWRLLAFGLALSVLAAIGWQRWLRVETSRRVVEQAIVFESQVRGRMASYVALLRGAAGLFAFRSDVSRTTFHRYVEQLNIQRNYPGTQGIGFSLRMTPAEMPEMVSRLRAEGLIDFRVWPEGGRPEYHAIIFLEPEDERNLAAIGYDMHTEPIRRRAMERAAETREPALSGKVSLVQEIHGEKQSGFLLYVPVYRDDDSTAAAEDEELLGFVYAPLRAGDFFFANTKRLNPEHVTIAVFDGVEMRPEAQLYGPEMKASETDWRTVRRIHQLAVADRVWTVVYGSPIRGAIPPWAVLAVGALLSLGMAVLLGSERRALRRAEWSEAEMLEREGELALVLRAIPGLVTFVDREGTVRLFNSRLQTWYGVPPGELIGRKISSILSPKMQRRVEPFIRRAEAGETVSFEHWINPGENGSKMRARYIATVLVPHRSRSGEITGFYAFSSDLTAHKRNEESAHFVADCSKQLIGTTDVEKSIASLVDVAVSRVADFATVMRVRSDGLHVVAVSHGRRKVTAELTEEFNGTEIPATFFDGADEALRLRSVVIVPDAAAKMAGWTELGEARRELLVSLGFASLLHVPVVVRGEVRYLLTLGTTALSGRRFEERDRAMGEEVATRLELAAENSLLVGEMQREIEDRRRAEQAARATEERFTAFVEAAREYAMILIDVHGVIVSWSPGAERLLGFTEEEAIGMIFDRLFNPEDRAAGMPHKELEQASRLGMAPDERWHLRKDGSRFWASGHTVALHDEHGAVNGFAKIMRDLTGWEITEEELEKRVRERTAQLNEAVEELEAFSYSVSHDLRSPLRSIQSFTQFTVEEAGNRLEPAQRDYLARVEQAAARLDRLISDLLAYTRVSKNRVPLGPVDLDGLIADILRDHPEFQPPRAMLNVAGKLGTVTGNEAYLTQCLTNLLGNAVKFVPSDRRPRIHIWGEERGGSRRVCVQDNGIGISPEHHDRIFRIFERLHPRGAYEGTGVGLAIVRRAMQRMNGTVGVQPAPQGEGTIFWIELPGALGGASEDTTV